MNEQSIYSEIILSKTGIPIPVLYNGKTVDSRYDPQKESLRLLEQIKPDTNFLIVIGIAGGVFIQTLLQTRKDIFVLAVEKSQADLKFLQQIKIVKEISQEKRVCLCSLEELENKIIEMYVPAFYGNLEVIEQRGWTIENKECLETINKSINKAVGIVSADFSVQSHFGKLWHHNIISNIKNLEYANNIENAFKFPVEKTAVIVAAGPTLDTTIKMILTTRENFYVIATDTALSILISYKIIPEAVISIDGQNVSNVHFIHNEKTSFSNTLFLFDLCANSSAVNQVINNKGKLCYFTSGHPLCEYLNNHYSLGLPKLFSGAGTVTISAVDFALQAGFESIITTGADFAYSNGKPYAKGTYLDRLYNQITNRMENIDKKFSALEFRTSLLVRNKTYTTQILEAYRTSFENYLQNNKLSFINENNIYKIKCCQNTNSICLNKNKDFKNSKTIIDDLLKTYSLKDSAISFNCIFDLKESDISLLPLISWLRNHDNKYKKNFNFYYEQALLICRNLGGNL